MLSFMRPFGCPVTILNTIDHLGKFDGKADEGFFVGYSLNSKGFRVFNSKTRIVKENLHIRFSKSTPNVVGSGPDWLFDVDVLTRTMIYEPIVASTQSNGFAGTKASNNACQARKETEPVKDYILLPLWIADPPYSQDLKSSHDDGSKPSSDDGKKVDEDPRKESECKDQEKEDNVNSTNNVNTISLTVNDAGINEVNAVGGKSSIELPFDPNMPALEDYSIFDFSRDDEDMEEPKKVIYALKDPSWIEAMQEELIQFKLQEFWTLVDLSNGKRAIGSKWVFMNKKDEGGIVIRNKARLVALGYTQEEGINYDEVFAPVAGIEVIRLFLAYASFKECLVYQMDVKSAFLYEKIEEEVYVCQPPGFEDPDFPDRVYKVEKALYGLHQAPRSWYETLSTYLLDNGFQRGKTNKTLFIKRHKGDILLVQVYVDDIICGSTKKELCIAFEKKPKRKDTQVPHPSDPTESVANEAVHKELGDSLVRAATTASILEAKQDSGNITKTRSKATPNESISLGTTSGGGPRCQETMRDTIFQTRVLDLEKTKTTQANEIASLKRRVKKLEKKNRSRTHRLKRLYKVGLIARVESSDDKEISVQDDADKEMFDVDALNGEEVFVARQNKNVVKEVVDAAQVSTAATTVTITSEEITLAQALEALKTSKPKVKGIVFQEQGKSTTTTTISSQQSQDKGKGILIELVKKKDQILLDEETALNLQAEFDKEEKLAREKAKKEQEANIALIETWDDIQAKIDADH
ncbi:retrovirus-related pol polyprotein from transposon TNT 1-94 [Tanacetum coccineum]